MIVITHSLKCIFEGGRQWRKGVGIVVMPINIHYDRK